MYINPEKDYLLNYSNVETQLQTLFYKNYDCIRNRKTLCTNRIPTKAL